MEDLSLHILDIVENSIRAGADRIEIRVCEDKENDLLSIEIIDNGKGMSEAILKKAVGPFFTTKKARRVGLGLPLLKQAAEMANGKFSIESKEGKGTRVKATFEYNHIDRKPLGNISKTIETLVVGNPSVDFYYEYRKDGILHILDTKKIKEHLSGMSISSSRGIELIRENLNMEENSR